MSESILTVQNLNVKYLTAGSPVHAVKDVSFDIARGEVFSLVGESGSGKSTIVQAVLRTLPPPAVITGGRAIVNGRDIFLMTPEEVQRFRWKEISIVMQSALNALNPVLSIRKQIYDVIAIHSSMTKSEAENRIREMFELIDIDHNRLDSFPHELSGGMRQRIVIAIALALMPPFVIMDEPTTALDVVVERDILLKVLELRKKLGFTILFITHDLNLILEFADRIAVMFKGQIIELSDAQSIGSGGKHEYTRRLIGAMPSAAGPRRKDLIPEYTHKVKPDKPLLEVKRLRKYFHLKGWFRPQVLKAVNDVSFNMYPSEIVSLVGESGSGKSTIARLIAKLDFPTSGSIILNGTDNSHGKMKSASLSYRKRVQMVFQDPYGSLNSVHTVYHHLARPLMRHKLANKGNLLDTVIQLLEQVGLSPGEEFALKFPHEMSGGERQRVAVARALSLNPDLIIADEPTSMLDVSIRLEILRLLANLRNEQNVAILFITHDLASARYLADRVIVLQNGSQIEEGQAEELVQSPQQIYTKQLIAAASPGWLRSSLEKRGLIS